MERIPKIVNYYKNYLKFFCNPVFRDFKANLVIQAYGDHKAKVYYKKNYGNQDEKIEEEQQDSKALKDVGKIFSETIKENINDNSLTQTYISILDDYVKFSDNKDNRDNKGGKSSHYRKEGNNGLNAYNFDIMNLNPQIKPLNTGGSCEESFINILSNMEKKDIIKDKLNKITTKTGDDHHSTRDKTNSKHEMLSNNLKKNKEQLIKECEKKIETVKNNKEEVNEYNCSYKNFFATSSSYKNNNELKFNQRTKSPDERKPPSTAAAYNNDYKHTFINSNKSSNNNYNKYGTIGLNLKNVFQKQPSDTTKKLETKIEKRENNYNYLSSDKRKEEHDYNKKFGNNLIKTTENHLGTEEVTSGNLKSLNFLQSTEHFETNANQKGGLKQHTKSCSTLIGNNNFLTYNPTSTLHTKSNNYNIMNTLKDILKTKESTTSNNRVTHSAKKKPSSGMFSNRKEDAIISDRHHLNNVLAGSHRPKEGSNNLPTHQTSTIRPQRSASSNLNFDLNARVYSPLASSIKAKQVEKKTNIISNIVKNTSTGKSSHTRKSSSDFFNSSNKQSNNNILKPSYSAKSKQQMTEGNNDNNPALITKYSYNDLGKPNFSNKNEKIEKITNVYKSKTSASPFRSASNNNKSKQFLYNALIRSQGKS